MAHLGNLKSFLRAEIFLGPVRPFLPAHLGDRTAFPALDRCRQTAPPAAGGGLRIRSRKGRIDPIAGL